MVERKAKIEQRATELLTNNWVLHVAFWVVYWVLSSMQDLVFSSHFKENFNLPILLGSIYVVYFNYYFWIDRYLIRRKRYGFYIISILTIIVANAWLVTVVLRNFFSDSKYYSSWEGTFTLAVDTLVLVAFTTAVKFVQQWNERNKYAARLEKKNLESELEMLKSQINPHFIFNTLNTIYFLLEQKEDVRAKEALLKFSDTLSHQLYDYNKDWIDLGKEVDYLKNYIELQRLRHDEELLKLDLQLPERVNGHHQIAPMLLIPFVENAFKHSSNSSGYQVKIKLEMKGKHLHFSTENTINPNKKMKPNGEAVEGGIGLVNVQRRLDLVYPKRHQLELEDDGKVYRADLKIEL